MTVIIVPMSRMAMTFGIETGLAMEHQEIHAERVQRSDEHANEGGIVGKRCPPDIGCTGRFNDVLFRIETREERRTDQGQRTDQERNPGHGHVLAQATHIADVLVMMHTDNDRTSTQEQQGFEERVGHEVKNCHRVRRCPQGNCHVAQL